MTSLKSNNEPESRVSLSITTREHVIILGIRQPGSNGAGAGYATDTASGDLENAGTSIPERWLLLRYQQQAYGIAVSLAGCHWYLRNYQH